MSTQPASLFERLPVEVLKQITDDLTTRDYSAVRQTCKIVERKTFEPWAREFFKEKQFMVSTFSLDALLSIARHPELSAVMQHLIIGTDTLNSDSSGDSRFTEVEIGRGTPYNDQRWLLRTATWPKKLADALASLPNLQAIEIRDFNSTSVSRDGGHQRSYGALTFERQTGRVCSLSITPDTLGLIFTGVLNAIALSKATPSSFQVCTRDSGVRDEIFHIPVDILSTLQPFLSNLRILHVTIIESNAPNLRLFLTHLPNLIWLTVNIDRQVPASHIIGQRNSISPDSFWEWFAQQPVSTSTTKTMPRSFLPNLKYLAMCDARFSPEHIIHMVEGYNLHSLTMIRPVFLDLAYLGGEPSLNMCAEMLRVLEGSSLEYLKVTLPSQKGQELVFGTWYVSRSYEAKCHCQTTGTADLEMPSQLYPEMMYTQAADDLRLEVTDMFDSNLEPVWDPGFDEETDFSDNDEDE